MQNLSVNSSVSFSEYVYFVLAPNYFLVTTMRVCSMKLYNKNSNVFNFYDICISMCSVLCIYCSKTFRFSLQLDMIVQESITHRLFGLSFGLLSSTEIRNLSVKEVTNSQSFDALKNPTYGGLYDRAFGEYIVKY